MPEETLETIARALVAPGKGILAADESTGTIEKRLKSIEVESTEDKRRDYREMLFTTPGSATTSRASSSTTRRSASPRGTAFRSRRCSRTPASSPASRSTRAPSLSQGAEGETVTEGLDGLRERLAEYHELGAKFTKWRAVIAIDGDKIPSAYCIHVNAHALARYAALSQEAGLVPIVEPEVLMDGEPHARALLRGHRGDAPGRLQRALLAAGRLRGNAAQAEHGRPRQGLPAAGQARRGRPRDDPLLQERRAGGRARDRVPLGRPGRRGGDGEPERDERARARTPGSSPSPTAARYRRRRSRRGRATTPTSRPARTRSPTAPA